MLQYHSCLYYSFGVWLCFYHSLGYGICIARLLGLGYGGVSKPGVLWQHNMGYVLIWQHNTVPIYNYRWHLTWLSSDKGHKHILRVRCKVRQKILVTVTISWKPIPGQLNQLIHSLVSPPTCGLRCLTIKLRTHCQQLRNPPLHRKVLFKLKVSIKMRVNKMVLESTLGCSQVLEFSNRWQCIPQGGSTNSIMLPHQWHPSCLVADVVSLCQSFTDDCPTAWCPVAVY